MGVGSRKQNVFHLREAGGKGAEVVVMLHEAKSAFNHRVLEIVRRLKRRNPAGKVLPYTQVSCSPANKLPWPYQA